MGIDELNRAFVGDESSGFVPPPRPFVDADIDRDGATNISYDPENGYQEIDEKIWRT